MPIDSLRIFSCSSRASTGGSSRWRTRRSGRPSPCCWRRSHCSSSACCGTGGRPGAGSALCSAQPGSGPAGTSRSLRDGELSRTDVRLGVLCRGALLAALGLSGRLDFARQGRGAWPGMGLAAAALAWPLLAVLDGRSWHEAEVVALAPDPTAVATLGLLVVGQRSRWTVLLCVAPVLWLALSAVTLVTMGAWQGWAVLAALLAGLAAWPHLGEGCPGDPDEGHGARPLPHRPPTPRATRSARPMSAGRSSASDSCRTLTAWPLPVVRARHRSCSTYGHDANSLSVPFGAHLRCGQARGGIATCRVEKGSGKPWQRRRP